MTVGELGERMEADELMEWIQFDEIHQSQDWLQTAKICVTMCQLMGLKTTKIDDFLPPRRKRDRPADPEVGSKFLAWALARVAAQEGRVVP